MDFGHAHEWSIALPVSEDTSIETWNAEVSGNMLSAKDYNTVLYNEQRFGMIIKGDVPTDDDGNYLSATFCFKPEL